MGEPREAAQFLMADDLVCDEHVPDPAMEHRLGPHAELGGPPTGKDRAGAAHLGLTPTCYRTMVTKTVLGGRRIMHLELPSLAEQRASKAEKFRCFSGLNLLHIRREVQKLLGLIGGNGIFDEYTRHDISHIDSMLYHLTELIIPTSTQELMTPTDWLLIVLGVYFHDLGMLVTKNEYRRRDDSDFPAFCRDLLSDQRGKDYENKLSRLPSDEQERFLYPEFVRANHAKRIRAWITNTERVELGVSSDVSDAIDQILSPLGQTFRFDLGLVCESHHLDNLDDFRTYKVSQPYGNSDLETGNLHYAALLLRTADLLHITQDRTPSIVFKTISPTDPLSQTEWAKQMAVRRIRSQVAKNPEGFHQPDLPRNTIDVHATFRDENGFFGLTSYLDYAERELKQNHAWGQLAQKQHGIRFEFPWQYIDQRPIETIGFLKEQYEFQIDTFKILELLTGHTLYNDSGVVLRELVQNSIDAVRLQFWDPTRKRSREEGRVAIHWDSQARVLTVTDNGTGMSQEIIKNHLLEVGSSRYQDPKFQEEHKDFSSISRFGIGVLSTFMIADEVEYLTYFPGEEQARRLLLRSVHGKYLVRLLDKTDNSVKHLVPHGTEVRLKLRHTAEMEDPRELAKIWIVVPDCSVTLQRDQGRVETIGFSSPKEALESITKTGYDPAVETGKRIKVEQVEENGVALAYALEWSEYFREWTFLPVREDRRPEQEVDADYLLGTCVEGIRVDADTPGFRERNIYAIANATGKLAPKTNVARLGLEMSSEVSELMLNIYSIYLRHVENEVHALQTERGFSPTWAAGESVFILRSLLRSAKESRQEVELIDTNAFARACDEARLVLIEDENDRKGAKRRKRRDDCLSLRSQFSSSVSTQHFFHKRTSAVICRSERFAVSASCNCR